MKLVRLDLSSKVVVEELKIATLDPASGADHTKKVVLGSSAYHGEEDRGSRHKGAQVSREA